MSSFFDDLMESVQQMDEIHRGERQLPNATTVEAVDELESGKGKRFESADELFKDLEI